MTTTVSVSTEVDAPIARAFYVFTAEIGTWWDDDKHILEAPLAEMVFEPFVGGAHHRPRHRRQRVPLGARPGL